MHRRPEASPLSPRPASPVGQSRERVWGRGRGGALRGSARRSGHGGYCFVRAWRRCPRGAPG